MTKRLFISALITIIAGISLAGQTNDTWTSFWNKDTTLLGYKDKNGVVKIQPRFSLLTRAGKFENIIAVSEEVNGSNRSYYLPKSGKIVGMDSLYVFDNAFDCENEGFIRFKDSKTDKVGMFDREGDIAIPAIYDDLTRVRNGLIIGLIGAEKIYTEGKEHYSWIGGKELLIDTNNNVLIDNFKSDNNYNFYSLIISSHPGSDTLRQNFKANDGQYYSFIAFDKEFKTWLKASLLDNFSKENLLKATFNEVSFWKEQSGWTFEMKSSFIERNYELIKSKLIELNSEKCEYIILNDGLNPFIYSSVNYEMFFNNCGESKDWLYPVMNIVITQKSYNEFLQDHFDFLRTDYGYRLISVTIRTGSVNLK